MMVSQHHLNRLVASLVLANPCEEKDGEFKTGVTHGREFHVVCVYCEEVYCDKCMIRSCQCQNDE